VETKNQTHFKGCATRPKHTDPDPQRERPNPLLIRLASDDRYLIVLSKLKESLYVLNL
jgi:hypothetical protein